MYLQHVAHVFADHIDTRACALQVATKQTSEVTIETTAATAPKRNTKTYICATVTAAKPSNSRGKAIVKAVTEDNDDNDNEDIDTNDNGNNDDTDEWEDVDDDDEDDDEWETDDEMEDDWWNVRLSDCASLWC